jgi:hypothetical protein
MLTDGSHQGRLSWENEARRYIEVALPKKKGCQAGISPISSLTIFSPKELPYFVSETGTGCFERKDLMPWAKRGSDRAVI